MPIVSSRDPPTLRTETAREMKTTGRTKTSATRIHPRVARIGGGPPRLHGRSEGRSRRGLPPEPLTDGSGSRGTRKPRVDPLRLAFVPAHPVQEYEGQGHHHDQHPALPHDGPGQVLIGDR